MASKDGKVGSDSTKIPVRFLRKQHYDRNPTTKSKWIKHAMSDNGQNFEIAQKWKFI